MCLGYGESTVTRRQTLWIKSQLCHVVSHACLERVPTTLSLKFCTITNTVCCFLRYFVSFYMLFSVVKKDNDPSTILQPGVYLLPTEVWISIPGSQNQAIRPLSQPRFSFDSHNIIWKHRYPIFPSLVELRKRTVDGTCSSTHGSTQKWKEDWALWSLVGFSSPIYLLCQIADGVFMSNQAEREEYVQQDAGIIYVGSANRIGMVGWNYGQVNKWELVSSLPRKLCN